MSGDGENAAMLPLAQDEQDDATATGGSSPADDLAVAEAGAYRLPTWSEFRTFVMANGNKYVRATYPGAPADLIETIWCGVPVVEHEHARVMTPGGEWLVY